MSAKRTTFCGHRGLVLRVADRVYSDEPINVVVRQTPTSGLLMKVSQQAHVVLSLGQRQLAIPLLEGVRCEFRGLNCCARDYRSAKFRISPLPMRRR